MANISGVTVSTSLASIPSNSAISLVNLGTSTGNVFVTSDKLTFGTGNTVTFGTNTTSAASGVYGGTVSGVTAAPYGDTSNYYAAEPGAGITFAYAATQHYFGMLWGSVDSYNTLSFYDGTKLIYTLTGSQVSASANGSQGSSGSDYVNINFSGEGYTSVVATSTSAAFEFATVASAATTVPVTAGQTGTPTSVTAIDSKTGKAVCFLRGTRIMTVAGEVAIEDLYARYKQNDLREEDRVVTALDGAPATMPIRWMGRRHIGQQEVARTGDHPVRVRQDAVAPGVPCRDLLVTPEHCLFLDGRLIPARMLVNGRSIVQDRTMSDFDIYHLELEQHSVLLAEAMTVESYLDTGNRTSFADEAVVALQPAFDRAEAPLTWEEHACAPLTTDRETVEPIWRGLAARAGVMNCMDTASCATITSDPDLKLLLDDGRIIRPDGAPGRRTFFRLPVGSRPVRLISRTSVPADVIGPFVDDRRVLGIKVDGLVFWRGLYDTQYAATDLTGNGWYAPEGEGRWTDGNAWLDLPIASDNQCYLEVGITGGLQGLAEPTKDSPLKAA